MTNQVDNLYHLIVQELEVAGNKSPYSADANEPDPKYKSYGVRAKEKKEIIGLFKKQIRTLSKENQIELATKLMQSRYGEQQSVALFILESFPLYYSRGNLEELDALIRCIHGWSKVDSFTGSLLRDVLFDNPDGLIKLVRSWNMDKNIWLRRTSVVLFTRKVAKSVKFTSIALEMCNNLIFDKEPLVLKGIGWALKDLMRIDKNQVMNYLIDLREKGVSSTVTLYAIKDLKGKERSNFLSI